MKLDKEIKRTKLWQALVGEGVETTVTPLFLENGKLDTTSSTGREEMFNGGDFIYDFEGGTLYGMNPNESYLSLRYRNTCSDITIKDFLITFNSLLKDSGLNYKLNFVGDNFELVREENESNQFKNNTTTETHYYNYQPVKYIHSGGTPKVTFNNDTETKPTGDNSDDGFCHDKWISLHGFYKHIKKGDYVSLKTTANPDLIVSGVVLDITSMGISFVTCNTQSLKTNIRYLYHGDNKVKATVHSKPESYPDYKTIKAYMRIDSMFQEEIKLRNKQMSNDDLMAASKRTLKECFGFKFDDESHKTKMEKAREKMLNMNIDEDINTSSTTGQSINYTDSSRLPRALIIKVKTHEREPQKEKEKRVNRIKSVTKDFANTMKGNGWHVFYVESESIDDAFDFVHYDYTDYEVINLGS